MGASLSEFAAKHFGSAKKPPKYSDVRKKKKP